VFEALAASEVLFLQEHEDIDAIIIGRSGPAAEICSAGFSFR
jgi:hypothetical protein